MKKNIFKLFLSKFGIYFLSKKEYNLYITEKEYIDRLSLSTYTRLNLLYIDQNERFFLNALKLYFKSKNILSEKNIFILLKNIQDLEFIESEESFIIKLNTYLPEVFLKDNPGILDEIQNYFKKYHYKPIIINLEKSLRESIYFKYYYNYLYLKED